VGNRDTTGIPMGQEELPLPLACLPAGLPDSRRIVHDLRTTSSKRARGSGMLHRGNNLQLTTMHHDHSATFPLHTPIRNLLILECPDAYHGGQHKACGKKGNGMAPSWKPTAIVRP